MAADTDSSNGQGKAAPEKASVIQILAQYTKDMSFENPNAPRVLQNLRNAPNVKVEFGVGVNKIADGLFESTLKLEALAKQDDTTLYNLDLTYAGVLRLDNVPEKAIHPVLLINAPALLFPFVRRIAADVTREGGFPPLLLDPVDFAALYAQNAAAARAKMQA